MEDRFRDAKWYIGGDPLSTTIFDASDPDGPGHAVVCRHAVIEDARLIAASPDLLAAAKAALDRFSDPALEGMAGDLLQELEEAIAKAEGRE
jgi:UTP-glucose-1-phosphate uridylyltransferase